MTIVLIGCVTGTVTRGRGSKIVGNLCDVIYGWSLQTASYPVSRVGCEPSPTMAAAGWKLAILGISVIVSLSSTQTVAEEGELSAGVEDAKKLLVSMRCDDWSCHLCCCKISDIHCILSHLVFSLVA